MNLIPSILTLLGTAVSLFSPEIQKAISAHPSAAVGLAGVYALIKGLLPSPIASSSSAAVKGGN